MPKPKLGDRPKKKSFIEGLRSIIEVLPSDEEKKEIQEKFANFVGFLNDIKDNIGLLPSKESMEEVNQAIKELIKKYESNPMVATLLGLRERPKKKSLKPKSKLSDETSTEKAKEALKFIEQLNPDELQKKLGSEEYTYSDLWAIAYELGVRHTQKINREKLVDLISSKIINYRGYQLLSGQPDKGKNTDS
jgi:hypothetical protein